MERIRPVVAVMSVKRRFANYLPDTLTSLRSALGDDIDYVIGVGNQDASHIPNTVPSDRISLIHPLLFESMQGRSTLFAITANMASLYREMYTRHPEATSYLVIEDDILFSSKAAQGIHDLHQGAMLQGSMWLASLCTAHSPGHFNVVGASGMVDLWQFRDPVEFWGQQALLYSPACFQWMMLHHEAVMKRWSALPPDQDAQFDMPGDQAIKWFSKLNGVPFYAPSVSLTNHVGRECSWGQGNDSHAWLQQTQRFVP